MRRNRGLSVKRELNNASGDRWLTPSSARVESIGSAARSLLFQRHPHSLRASHIADPTDAAHGSPATGPTGGGHKRSVVVGVAAVARSLTGFPQNPLPPESASPRIRIPPKRRLADNPQDNPAALASTLRRRLLHFDKSCLKISECMEPAKRCDSSINGADDRDFLRWEGCHFPFSLTLLSCHFDQSKRSGQM